MVEVQRAGQRHGQGEKHERLARRAEPRNKHGCGKQ